MPTHQSMKLIPWTNMPTGFKTRPTASKVCLCFKHCDKWFVSDLKDNEKKVNHSLRASETFWTQILRAIIP